MTNTQPAQASDEPAAAQFKMPGETWEECSIDAEEAMLARGYKFRYLYAKPVIPAAGAVDDAASFRLLHRGDRIQPDDEFLSDDCKEWASDPYGIFVGTEYMPRVFKPARRKVIDAAISAQQGPEGKQ